MLYEGHLSCDTKLMRVGLSILVVFSVDRKNDASIAPFRQIMRYSVQVNCSSVRAAAVDQSKSRPRRLLRLDASVNSERSR